jgi:hypothetical protein
MWGMMLLKVIDLAYDEWIDSEMAVGVRLITVMKAKTAKSSWKVALVMPMLGACDVWEGASREKGLAAIVKMGFIGVK